MVFVKKLLSLSWDIIESFGLLIGSIFAVAFTLLKRMDLIYRVPWLIRFLLPNALFAVYLRALLDARLGNHNQSAVYLHQIIAQLEKKIRVSKVQNHSLYSLLILLYTQLIKGYLLNCRVEEAAITVIKACQALEIPCLPEIPELDLKTAHILKAGMAAGRLLNESGLATLTLNTPPKSERRSRFTQISKTKKSSNSGRAKILPFPHILRT